MTAFIGLLDPAGGRIEYSSAGHGPILEFDAAAGTVTEHPTHGTPLGMFPGMEYDPPSRIDLEPGDMLLLFTDGFLEWSRADGEQFGAERLAEVVRRLRDRPAAEIIAAVDAAVRAFAAGTPQADDCTAVIVKRLPPAAPPLPPGDPP